MRRVIMAFQMRHLHFTTVMILTCGVGYATILSNSVLCCVDEHFFQAHQEQAVHIQELKLRQQQVGFSSAVTLVKCRFSCLVFSRSGY